MAVASYLVQVLKQVHGHVYVLVHVRAYAMQSKQISRQSSPREVCPQGLPGVKGGDRAVMHSRLDLGFARAHHGMMEEVILSTEHAEQG